MGFWTRVRLPSGPLEMNSQRARQIRTFGSFLLLRLLQGYFGYNMMDNEDKAGNYTTCPFFPIMVEYSRCYWWLCFCQTLAGRGMDSIMR